MTDKNKFLPPLVCGFGAAVLNIIPGLKSIGFCLIVPLAAILALVLNQKINKAEPPVKAGTAILYGLLTGIFSALFLTFFEVILTLITKSNEVVAAWPQVKTLFQQYQNDPVFQESMKSFDRMIVDIETKGFSLFYTIVLLFGYSVIYSIFGIVGGLLGMIFVNKRTQV